MCVSREERNNVHEKIRYEQHSGTRNVTKLFDNKLDGQEYVVPNLTVSDKTAAIIHYVRFFGNGFIWGAGGYKRSQCAIQ